MTHPTISQKAVVAALDSYDNPLAPYGWRNASGALQAQLRFDMERAIRAALAVDGVVPQGWQTIDSAPKDGREALVFRPLAHNSNDQPITVKRLIGGNHYCWPRTVPEGQTPYNPTDGACHVTHWMPLPAAPTGTEG